MGSGNKPSIEELSAKVQYLEKVNTDAQEEIKELKKEKKDSDKRLDIIEKSLAAATTTILAFVGAITFVLTFWNQLGAITKSIIKWVFPEAKL